MVKKEVSILFLTIIYLFFSISLYSYAHLNWGEDFFLIVLLCAYVASRIFARTTQGTQNNFLIFFLLYLLSQFYINNFHPESVGWWFFSVPGWLTVFATFFGVTSLVYQQRSIKNKGTDDRRIKAFDETLHVLINKAIPGIIVVSVGMFFLFILNIDKISPQGRLVPDYSIYIVIAFGFVLFYSLNYLFQSISMEKIRTFVQPVALAVFVFLLVFGSIKIYQVYAAYRNAIRAEAFMGEAGSDWKAKWREVLELNRIPGIESISTRATVELAKIRIEQGDFRQASNYYKKILADQAFNFEANEGFAEVAFKQKEWRKAWEAYERAIYLRPKEKSLYSAYIHACIKDGKIDRASEFIGSLKGTRAITLDDPEDYLIIGNALLKRKRLNEAIVYLQKGKESMPQNYRGFLLLGKAYLESVQYVDACGLLERAVQLNPNLAEGHYYLGIGYENIHQDHKALEAYEKSVSIDNKNIKAYHNLKRLYTKIGLQNEALKAANAIERIATSVVEAVDWKGRSGKNVYRNGNMYWKGRISAPVSLKEGHVRFILQARGTQAKGIWPHMVVILDDEIIGEVDVTSEELKDYEFKKTVRAGKYYLYISFTNDGVTVDKKGKLIEDRNLCVRNCEIVYEE